MQNNYPVLRPGKWLLYCIVSYFWRFNCVHKLLYCV